MIEEELARPIQRKLVAKIHTFNLSPRTHEEPTRWRRKAGKTEVRQESESKKDSEFQRLIPGDFFTNQCRDFSRESRTSSFIIILIKFKDYLGKNSRRKSNSFPGRNPNPSRIQAGLHTINRTPSPHYSHTSEIRNQSFSSLVIVPYRFRVSDSYRRRIFRPLHCFRRLHQYIYISRLVSWDLWCLIQLLNVVFLEQWVAKYLSGILETGYFLMFMS